MQKDYFSIAHRGFRAISWIFGLALVWGILAFLEQGPTPVVLLFVGQFALEFALCFIATKKFKNKSRKAIVWGYAALLAMLVFGALAFSASPASAVGIISIAIFVYLLFITIKAQGQAKTLPQ